MTSKSGNMDVTYSGSVASFNGSPIFLEFNLPEKQGYNYTLSFVFINDQNIKEDTIIKLNSKDSSKSLEFSLINFVTDLSAGISEPYMFFQTNKNKYYLYFYVSAIQKKNPVLHYTVFKESKNNA